VSERRDLERSGTPSTPTSAARLDLPLVNDRFDVGPIVQTLSSAGITPAELQASGPAGLKMSLRGPSNNVLAQIEAKLDDLKVSDSRALKGNVTGELQLSVPTGTDSPIRSMRGDGRLAARDGDLTNVDLVNRIEQITGLAGMAKEQRSGATTFETLETDFGIAGGMADLANLPAQSGDGGSGSRKNESGDPDVGSQSRSGARVRHFGARGWRQSRDLLKR
jgi:AsmA-like C-terminal region